jgi:hypothetical protein
VASEIQKPVHSCGTTAKATGFNDSFVFARGTHFVPLNQQPKLALSEMKKLYPGWKVYQERMGYGPSTAPIALWEVTVNKACHMSAFLIPDKLLRSMTIEASYSSILG